MRVIFLGTRKLGYEGLKRLIEDGHDIAAVITEEYDITEGYSINEFKELCNQYNITCYIGDKINNSEFESLLISIDADIGVSLYWRRLIKANITRTTKYGFINIHCSDLPKYRGFAATSYAILLGDDKIGITLHYIVPGEADTGDIIRKEYINITNKTTIKTLFDEINPLAIDMVATALKDMDLGIFTRIQQDSNICINAYPRLPIDGEIDWSKSALEIDRLVRAVTKPYPGAYTFYNSKKVYLWEAEVLENPPEFVGSPGHIIKLNADGTVWVTTGKGLLVLKEVQEIDQICSQIPGQIFKSIQIRLGINTSEEIMNLYKEINYLKKEIEDIKNKI